MRFRELQLGLENGRVSGREDPETEGTVRQVFR